ncbi:MAG TPA: Uma2 family endonuclease [Pirellulaceae bacterium]|nr:Uma2 family endonuclease [Pirellulaceae bacterium]
MNAMLMSLPQPPTMEDVLERLGGVSPSRIRFQPLPGEATVQDVVEIESRENRLFELVDGVLVEKVMGLRESILAAALAELLRRFVVPRNLGVVSGPDGMLQLFPGLVRMPDVAYVSWQRIPGGEIPAEPAPLLAPDLAVEILSRSNTPAEMSRKLGEYFEAGVSQVWFVDLDSRTITVYRSPDSADVHSVPAVIDGGSLLPGFSLPLAELFAELDRRGNSPPGT